MIIDDYDSFFPFSGSPQWLKANGLARQGFKVFPCREIDSFENGVLKKKKSPYTARGFLDATTDPILVHSMFRRWPAAFVGVWCGGSNLVVLDLDIKGSTSGEQELLKRDLDFDSSLMYRTPSGGLHVWFSEYPNQKIRPSVNFLGLPGVDIRAGNSYSIYYGEEITIPQLPHPPEWLGQTRSRKSSGFDGTRNLNGVFSGDVQLWVDWLGSDEPFWSSKAISQEISELDHIGHHDLIRLLVWIHQTRLEGESSLGPVLASLISKFQSTTNNPSWERELNDAVRWVIGSEWKPEEREI